MSRKVSLVYMPTVHKGMMAKHPRGFIKGKGMGSVLLDGGLGGQSSYHSLDDYVATTNAPVPSGSGIKGMDAFNKKLENLMIKPSVRKAKNINFNM